MNQFIHSASSPTIMIMVADSWKKHSSEIALVYDNESVTYDMLSQRVQELSNILIHDAREEEIIALTSSRGVQMIVNMLAILQAGKTYLPIDASFPAKRIAQIVEDCGVKYYLKSNTNDTLPLISIGLSQFVRMEQPALKNHSSLAYILYTSGSTGSPKGVCVPHEGIINLMNWQMKESISAPGINTLQFTRLTFDISVQEIFSTLCSGGTLHIVDNEVLRDNQLLVQALNSLEIHRIFLPFVALQGIANEADNFKIYPRFLKEVLTCGEQLKSTRAVRNLFLNVENARLFNQYGPTECTCIVTHLALDPNPETWDELPTIGKEIEGVQALILDKELKPITQIGSIGEVYFSGVCIAEGYLNKPELTNKSFFNLSIDGNSEQRVYKTGDLGNWTEEGEIFFLGRIDDQIKINGFRIETGEIEAVAAQLIGVSQVAITVNQFEDGQKYLKLYFVSNKVQVSEIDVLNFLKERLPAYMIPTSCIWMKEFPQTVNGKIDRKKLSELKSTENPNTSNFSKPRNEVERKLAMIWESILEIEQVGREDHFFELGGSSILAQKMAIQINQSFHKDFSVTRIYQFPKLRTQAEFLSKNEFNARKVISKKDLGQSRDVAVIATAGRFPGASNPADFWDLLVDGRESIRFFEIDELDGNEKQLAQANSNYIRARGIIEDIKTFDYEFFGLNPKIAAVMDPQQRLFLEVAYEALEVAGYIAEKPVDKVGVFAGCSSNAYYQKNIVFDSNLPQVLGPIQIMSVNEKDYMATRVAFQLDLRGPAISVHTACSTSLVAVASAVQSIRNGECKMAIAGGSSVAYPVNSGHLFEEGSIMSKDGHCKPFDATASGTLFSDGAGAVLLKDYEQALADGDSIMALIKGVGVNNDGFSKSSFSAPSVEGQAEAIQMALEDGGVLASSISYVEAHGTATPIGDPIEIEALKLAFGTDVKNQTCAIGSVKGNIGHLNAAAGIVGLIKTIHSLQEKIIPASIGYSIPNPAIDFERTPFYVNSATSYWKSDQIRRAGVSSFGIGGTNCHVVLEEYLTVPKREISFDKIDQTIFFSAKTEKSLIGYAEKLQDFILKNPSINLAHLAYNINKKNPNYNLGASLHFETKESLILSLKAIISKEQLGVKKMGDFNLPIFVFPGQGAQYLNMGQGLYETEPVFAAAMDQCNLLFEQELDFGLLSLIFSEESAEEMELRLDDTKYTQPVIFAVSYSLAKLWMSKGVIPAALIGHSIGEFAAACIAGVFSLEDAVKLVSKRGKLISNLTPGSMLSIRSSKDIILPILPANLSLAAANAPNLCVVSGPSDLISDFASELEKGEIPAKILRTSHAFHSQMMEPALDEFKKIVGQIKLKNPQIPILSTVTGDWMKDSEATSPDYWSQHMRLPVLFSKAVSKALEDMPEGVFVEVGPGNGLGTLLMQHSDAKSFPIVNSLNRVSGLSELDHFRIQFQSLIVKGLRLDWDEIYSESDRDKIIIPTYAFDKKPCWIDARPSQLEVNVGQVINLEIPEVATIGYLSTEVTSSARPATLKRLINILEEASGAEMKEDDLDLSYFEIGLDSLILTQVAFSLKKEFKVQISFKQLSGELNTPLLLLDYIVNNSEAESASKKNHVQTLNGLAIEDAIQVSKKQQLNGNYRKDEFAELSAEEILELRKPFGAVARIEKHASEVSEVANVFIQSLIKSYSSKTGKSKAYTQENRKHTADPRVVSGFKPMTKEMIYPIVTKFSNGSRLIDLDDNNYLDWLNGFGCTMFGYQSDFINQAIIAQIKKGIEIGPQNALAGKVSERICRLTGNDRVGLCNTGSEAVLGAMRISRTVSQRSLIVSFAGSYHGINDEVIIRASKSGKTFPAAAGILGENVQQMLVLEYGTEETLRIISERADEIAAVLVEPVQSRRPEFVPIEFLKVLREITAKKEVCLIFDEIITGFRSHIGGFQALYGIKADLTTYGKVLGGGFSIGVIAGKTKWMDALDGGFWQYGDDSIPEVGLTYFAGTFVRHPLTLATTDAVLTYMEARGDSLQNDMAYLADEMVNGLNRIFKKYDVTYYAVNFTSLWKIKQKEDFPYYELFFTMLRERNIHIWENFPCYVTDAHTLADVHFTLIQVEEVLQILIQNDIVKGDLFLASDQWMSLDNPPFEGARITLNAQGYPIWVNQEDYKKTSGLKLQSIFL